MNKRSYIDQIRDYFFYASKPVCGKEIMETTGIIKSTLYNAIRRLREKRFIKEVQSPEYPNKYYVLNIRTYNPLDSWMPNRDTLLQIMQAIGTGTTFSELLELPYSKETITVYLRALYAERIIGCKNRMYYLIEKDVNKVQLADLKSYPTLTELKGIMKSAPAPEKIIAQEPEDWDAVHDQIKKRL